MMIDWEIELVPSKSLYVKNKLAQTLNIEKVILPSWSEAVESLWRPRYL